MLRLKSYVLLAMFASGVALESNCHAQVDCLQYSVYDDGMGDLLFLTDVYTTNDPDSTPPCGEYLGEDYIWVSVPVGTVPQVCGDCLVDGSDLARRANRSFLGNLPASTFKLGTDVSGKPLTAVPGSPLKTPSAGISIGASSLVWVKSKSGPIPVKLFRAYLDYAAAGVPKSLWPSQGRYRGIFVGIEVKPDGLAKPVTVYTPSQVGKATNAGSIDVKAFHETHTYHVVSKTPLF